jgi:hypothetical protein
MKGLAAVVVVPLAALAFVHVATSLMPAPAPAQAMYPQSILWAGRVFTSKAEFAGWLSRHDESYRHWVKLHPGASPWEPRPAASIDAARPKPKSDGGGIDFRRGLPILYVGLLAAAVAFAVRARGMLVSAVAGPVRALTVPRLTVPRPTIRPPDIRGAAFRAFDRVSVAVEREPPPPLPPVALVEEYDDTPPGPGEVFCEIDFWRGYVKGQFLARLRQVDGEPVIARSDFFRSRTTPPERTPEAEHALAGLLEWLDRDGWRAYAARGPWYSRWYVGTWPSGPPLRITDSTR